MDHVVEQQRESKHMVEEQTRLSKVIGARRPSSLFLLGATSPQPHPHLRRHPRPSQALLDEVKQLKAEFAAQSEERRRSERLVEELQQLKDDMRMLLTRTSIPASSPTLYT
jgi:hypothetical protein